MSSSDDPEARIRELERTLSERTAELTRSSADVGQVGVGGYDPPPTSAPPPYSAPPSYTAPLPTAQTTSSRSPGRGWLMIVVLMTVTSSILAGTAVYLWNAFSGVSSLIDLPANGPTVAGGGGPFGQQPGPSGANRPRITISAPSASTPPPGSDITVSGVGEDKTIECNDGMVSISGVSNTVELIGYCTSVTVSGMENVVTIDTADAITASGLNNRVTYRSGMPTIQNSGSSNVIELG